MTNKKTTEIVSEIVELLTPIDSAERARVIQASMMLLGEALPAGPPRAGTDGGNIAGDNEGETSALSARARTWMKQNGVSLEELQQVFHLESGSAEVIAGDIPGKNKKEKTYSAYILTGLSKLLSTGSPAFDDKAARALCESSGCYDNANHSVTIRERGNEFTGTKEKGWSLTAPGLKRAAVLVKETTKG
jgi:hypothetical protein